MSAEDRIKTVAGKVQIALDRELALVRKAKGEQEAEEQRIIDQRGKAELYWKKGARSADQRIYTLWLWGYLENEGELEYVAAGMSHQLIFLRVDPNKRKHKLTGIEGPWTLTFIPEGTIVELPSDLSELHNCIFFDFNGYKLIRSPQCEFKVCLFTNTHTEFQGLANMFKEDQPVDYMGMRKKA